MLRYLLIYLNGGTWSDMDTVPIRHLTNWSSDIGPFVAPNAPHYKRSASRASAMSPRSQDDNQPVRAIIGIECAPQWWSLRGAIELLYIKPLARHRNLQFVQWTIHFAPHHPILLDVIRRILDTTEIYQSILMLMEREQERQGWGWHEGSGSKPSDRMQNASDTARPAAPWESTRQQWMWSKGHWRLGWHETSVEEWTGPAAWTDSVVS
jgi:alpha 1,6-mannosyltransferase